MWVPPTDLDAIQLARFNASKGELVELAKIQVRDHHGNLRHVLIFFVARPPRREGWSFAQKTTLCKHLCRRNTIRTAQNTLIDAPDKQARSHPGSWGQGGIL